MKNSVKLTLIMCLFTLTGWAAEPVVYMGSEVDTVPVGKLFMYQKSNLDDTNTGKIAVYYSKRGEIESFKWHEGNNKATVVRATIDPTSLNVISFKVHKLYSNGKKKIQGVLAVNDANEMELQLGENNQLYKVECESWHSYDFDFQSLNYAYRFIMNKKSIPQFNILDIDLFNEPRLFKDFGTVELKFIKEEKKWSRNVLKYQLDGPGLDMRGGTIWFDKEGEYLVAFDIQRPDEPGYDSGKLRLLEVLELDNDGWEAFKLKCINDE